VKLHPDLLQKHQLYAEKQIEKPGSRPLYVASPILIFF
jgi:hypothetical protein